MSNDIGIPFHFSPTLNTFVPFKELEINMIFYLEISMIFYKKPVRFNSGNRILISLIYLVCCFGLQQAEAQRGGSSGGGRGNNNNPNRPTGGGQIQFASDEEPDTSKVFYFYADEPNNEFIYLDTLIDNYYHQYRPERKRDYDYGSLGYLGSPLHQLIYQPRFHRGFEVGLNQFDLYKIRTSDLRFFNLKKPISDFYFSQGGAQDDLQLKGKFGRDFAKGIKLSIDFHRISQFGTTSPIPYFYQNQKARQTAFAAGLAFENTKKTYRSFFIASNNVHQQNDNGGIQDDSFFDNQTSDFESNLNVPVWLADASTRYAEQEIQYTQYFIFSKKDKTSTPPTLPADSLLLNTTDSLTIIENDSLVNNPIDSILQNTTDTLSNQLSEQSGKSNRNANPNSRPRSGRPQFLRPSLPVPTADTTRKFTLAHSLIYRSGKYKFADANPSNASSYWGNFLVDTRGLRHFVSTRQIENKFSLSTFKGRKTKEGEAKLQNDLLDLGISHTISWINQEAEDSIVNNVFLNGKWHFNPNEKLKVETYAHFGLLANVGDYRLNGNLFFNLKKLGQLQLSVTNQLYKPNLLQQRIYISENLVWQNDFGRTLETNLSATYALPKIKFKATGEYHLLNNFIYYDTLATPQQFTGAMSIFQLTLAQNFKVGKFHLDNLVTVQTVTESVLQLPSFYSKHSLYYEGNWFKRVLNIRLGFDLRMNNSYFANTYNPLVGQFHLQEVNKVNFYPSVDAYTSFKVGKFRFFTKGENLTALFKSGSDKYYQVANYPMHESLLRLGLSWRLSN